MYSQSMCLLALLRRLINYNMYSDACMFYAADFCQIALTANQLFVHVNESTVLLVSGLV